MLSANTVTRMCAIGSVVVLLASGCRLLPTGSGGVPARPSPYEHDGPEIGEGGAPPVVPSVSPIIYRSPYQSERDLFEYDPRFMPTGAVAFDALNRPYIRASRPDRDVGDGTEDGFIQFLNDPDDGWHTYSLVDVLRRHLGVPEVTIGTGVRAYDTRVVCDTAGDLYTFVRVTSPMNGRFILHRPGESGVWEVYPVPMGGRLESTGIPDNTLGHPPMLVGHVEGRPSFILIRKARDGSLLLDDPVPFAPEGAGLNPAHSGAGPIAATVGNRTYFVYSSSDPVPRKGRSTNGAPFSSAKLAEAEKGSEHPGTPQYVVYYDHENSTVSTPVLLGFGQNPYTPKPDNHNCPAIVADSHGYLHVVLGAHQHNFWYVRSRSASPETRDDWTVPEALGFRRRYDCGLTYVALAVDSQDRLHLVARNMSRGYAADGTPLPAEEMNAESMMRTLDYLRATPEADGSWSWEELGALVMPLWHRAYSIFYHKLSVDRRDRLFLTYSYFAAQLPDDAVAAYRAKWPDEKVPEPPPKGMWMRPHDPAILLSEDGGTTWRLALTPDFLDGIKTD